MNPWRPVHMSASFRILSRARSTISFPTAPQTHNRTQLSTVDAWNEFTRVEKGGFDRTGVVSASEVVGGIFLATDELLGVEELSVRARAHLVDHGRLQVQEHAARDVLACSRFTEERVEGIVASAHRLVTGHLPIRLQHHNGHE